MNNPREIEIHQKAYQKGYKQGAKEFAEWAEEKGYFDDDYHTPILSDMLAEWQKGN